MKENFVVHANYKHLKNELLSCIQNFETSGINVVEGERNVIKKFTIKDFQINIKKFKNPNLFNKYIYQFFRKSKAKRSFEYATKLIDCGIQTPFPIAYYEKFEGGLTESYYISEHVDYDFDFRVLIHNPKFKNREEILRQFANFTFKLHENGINFLDHSPGNTLVKEIETKNKIDTSAPLSNLASAPLGNRISEDFQYEFYLIDLNRMRFEVMDFEKRMHNFRRLWLSKTMLKILSEEYSKLYGKTYEEVHSLMSKHSKAFQKKVNSKKLRNK